MSEPHSSPRSDDWLLIEFLLGDLDQAEAAELSQRLSREPELAARTQQLRPLAQAVADLAASQPSASEEASFDADSIAAGVHARIQEETDAPRSRRRRVSSRRKVSSSLSLARRKRSKVSAYLAVAAAVLAAFGIVFVFKWQRPEPRGRKRQQVADKSRPERPAGSLVTKSEGQAESVKQHPAPKSEPAPATVPKIAKLSEKPGSVVHEPVEKQPVESVQQPLPQSPQPRQPASIAKVAPPEKQALGLAPRTATAIGRIAQLQGRVQYARGAAGTWANAVEGVRLLPGDRLDTSKGVARIHIQAGGVVYANRGTVLRLVYAIAEEGEVTLIDLVKGEVFVEDFNQQIHALTSDGLFAPVGTCFAVKTTPSATVVKVVQGSVRARARSKVKAGNSRDAAQDQGSTTRVDLRLKTWIQQVERVEAGYQSRVEAGRKPASPTKAKVLMTWVDKFNRRTGRELKVKLGDGVAMEFVRIPAGEFLMGARGTRKQRVRIDRPFYMAKYEVTQAQYEKVMDTNPSKIQRADLPVYSIFAKDAQAFCRKLSQRLRLPVRLPTDVEWEYACRAGTNTRYYKGDSHQDIHAISWHSENSGGRPHPVGGKLPNVWGLYDMHGNVYERCTVSGKQTPTTVLRGGSYKVSQNFHRVHQQLPGRQQKSDIGIRLVIPLAKAPRQR